MVVPKELDLGSMTHAERIACYHHYIYGIPKDIKSDIRKIPFDPDMPIGLHENSRIIPNIFEADNQSLTPLEIIRKRFSVGVMYTSIDSNGNARLCESMVCIGSKLSSYRQYEYNYCPEYEIHSSLIELVGIEDEVESDVSFMMRRARKEDVTLDVTKIPHEVPRKFPMKYFMKPKIKYEYQIRQNFKGKLNLRDVITPHNSKVKIPQYLVPRIISETAKMPVITNILIIGGLEYQSIYPDFSFMYSDLAYRAVIASITL